MTTASKGMLESRLTIDNRRTALDIYWLKGNKDRVIPALSSKASTKALFAVCREDSRTPPPATIERHRNRSDSRLTLLEHADYTPSRGLTIYAQIA